MRAGLQPYRPDLFEFFGPVYLRRMFGGAGVFSGDVMIGIVFEDRLFLKADENTREAFIAEGARPFVYRVRSGEQISMSYYEVADRLYDEPEEFADWVRRAYAIAERSPAVQKKRRVLTTGKSARRRKKSVRG